MSLMVSCSFHCTVHYIVQRKEQASALNQEKEKWRQEKSSLLSEIHLLKGRSLSPNPTPLLSSSATSNENSRTCSPEENLETSMMRVSEQCLKCMVWWRFEGLRPVMAYLSDIVFYYSIQFWPGQHKLPETLPLSSTLLWMC